MPEIDKALAEAAARHKFGVIASLNLKQTMANKGVDFAGECVIYEVCNPHNAKRALEADGAVSTALPCRISVYRSGDEFRVATILPTKLMGMFGNPELETVAAEVESALKSIIDETA